MWITGEGLASKDEGSYNCVRKRNVKKAKEVHC